MRASLGASPAKTKRTAPRHGQGEERQAAAERSPLLNLPDHVLTAAFRLGGLDGGDLAALRLSARDLVLPASAAVTSLRPSSLSAGLRSFPALQRLDLTALRPEEWREELLAGLAQVGASKEGTLLAVPHTSHAEAAPGPSRTVEAAPPGGGAWSLSATPAAAPSCTHLRPRPSADGRDFPGGGQGLPAADAGWDRGHRRAGRPAAGAGGHGGTHLRRRDAPAGPAHAPDLALAARLLQALRRRAAGAVLQECMCRRGRGEHGEALCKCTS